MKMKEASYNRTKAMPTIVQRVYPNETIQILELKDHRTTLQRNLTNSQAQMQFLIDYLLAHGIPLSDVNQWV